MFRLAKDPLSGHLNQLIKYIMACVDIVGTRITCRVLKYS
jgi:hypothetical protein